MRLNKTMKMVLAFGIIGLGAIAVSMLKLDDSMVVFLTPAEATTKAPDLQGRKIRVGGMVKSGTLQWEPNTLMLDFVLSDLQGVDIEVSHKGTPPDMFKEGAGVVVEGRIDDAGARMSSQKLLVKHSEEYKKPGDHATLDPNLIKEEILKNQSVSE